MLAFISATGKGVEFWVEDRRLFYSVAKSKRRGPVWALDNSNRGQIAIPALNRLLTLPDDLQERERIRQELAGLADSIGVKHNIVLNTSAGTEAFAIPTAAAAQAHPSAPASVAGSSAHSAVGGTGPAGDPTASPETQPPPLRESQPSIPTGVVNIPGTATPPVVGRGGAAAPAAPAHASRSPSGFGSAAALRPPSPGIPTASEKAHLYPHGARDQPAAPAPQPTPQFVGGAAPPGGKYVACPGCHGVSYCEVWCNANWYPPALVRSPAAATADTPPDAAAPPRSGPPSADGAPGSDSAPPTQQPDSVRGFKFDDVQSLARAAHRCFQVDPSHTKAKQISDIPSVLQFTPPSSLPAEYTLLQAADGETSPGYMFDVEVVKDRSRRISVGVAGSDGEVLELRSDGRLFMAGRQMASASQVHVGSRVCVLVRAPAAYPAGGADPTTPSLADFLPARPDGATVQFFVDNFPATEPIACKSLMAAGDCPPSDPTGGIFTLVPQVRLDMVGDEVRLISRDTMPADIFKCDEAVRIARGAAQEHKKMCTQLAKNLKAAADEKSEQLEEIARLRHETERLEEVIAQKDEEGIALRVQTSASDAERSRLEMELEETKKHGDHMLELTRQMVDQLESAGKSQQEELDSVTSVAESRKDEVERLSESVAKLTSKLEEYEEQKVLYADVDTRHKNISLEIDRLKGAVVSQTQKNRELKAQHEAERAKWKAAKASGEQLLQEATERHTVQLGLMEGRARTLSQHMEGMAAQVQNSAVALEQLKRDSAAKVRDLEGVIARQQARMAEYEALEGLVVETPREGGGAASPKTLHSAVQAYTARSMQHAEDAALLRNENAALQQEIHTLVEALAEREQRSSNVTTSATSPLRAVSPAPGGDGAASQHGSLRNFLQSMHVRPRVAVRNAHAQTHPHRCRPAVYNPSLRVVIAHTRATLLAKHFRKLMTFALRRRGGGGRGCDDTTAAAAAIAAGGMRRGTPKERSLAALEKAMKEMLLNPQAGLGDGPSVPSAPMAPSEWPRFTAVLRAEQPQGESSHTRPQQLQRYHTQGADGTVAGTAPRAVPSQRSSAGARPGRRQSSPRIEELRQMLAEHGRRQQQQQQYPSGARERPHPQPRQPQPQQPHTAHVDHHRLAPMSRGLNEFLTTHPQQQQQQRQQQPPAHHVETQPPPKSGLAAKLVQAVANGQAQPQAQRQLSHAQMHQAPTSYAGGDGGGVGSGRGSGGCGWTPLLRCGSRGGGGSRRSATTGCAPRPELTWRKVLLWEASGSTFVAMAHAMRQRGFPVDAAGRGDLHKRGIVELASTCSMLLMEKSPAEQLIQEWEVIKHRQRRHTVPDGGVAGRRRNSSAGGGNATGMPATAAAATRRLSASPITGRRGSSATNRHVYINYYRGLRCITLKFQMAERLAKVPGSSQWLPMTFCLRPGGGGGDQRSAFHTHWLHYRNVEVTEGGGARRGSAKSGCLWIAKPSSGAKGDNILITSSYRKAVDRVDAEPNVYPWVVQRYLPYPFLVHGRKVDIRSWVLIDPKQRVFVGRRGVVRTSSAPYRVDDYGNQLSHLTNHSIQEQGPDFGAHEKGNEMWYDAFATYMAHVTRGRVSFDDNIVPQMDRITRETLRAARPEMTIPTPPLHSFQLLGFDFLIDDAFNVWLLEVNGSPMIADDLREDMVDDILEIVHGDVAQMATRLRQNHFECIDAPE